MNPTSNFIARSLGLCPLPTTNSKPTCGGQTRTIQDPLHREIANFLDNKTRFDSDGFWENTLSNDRIFYQLVRLVEWDLAERFYKANPDIKLSHAENSPCSSSLALLMEGIKGNLKGNLGYSEKGDVYKLLLLILENDASINLFQEMSLPHKRVLDFLVHTNQVKLVHKFMENLLSCPDDRVRDQAKRIFKAIADILEKEKNPPPVKEEDWISVAHSALTDFYEKDLSCWNVYLSLIKETYPEVFSEIEFSNPTLDLTAEAISTLVNRLRLPAEIYEKIAREIILDDRTEDLRKHLIPRFQLEPKVSEETLIKLTTLSFLAFEENSKVKLHIEQKKQFFRFISKAILKNGSIFNAEIKERIVKEIGEMNHFSNSNIKKALKRAFN
ncbi:hypothetical protein [Criblamydia sequanensis]|uniref:Uncharacterized protein n=1 Tax=Candidatus Criblamydia sequanensis CRIB-18 TaxID=1437425 RepID=A0A090D0M8_9BACT|nr:hypothetical protein [Criblamydia sequanensis]CDR33405.1 hypothetical protein CSEC_0572 [Criblamydia sequanensis CRIB-18]